MLIGINGGYFPAICRVCLNYLGYRRQRCAYKNDFFLQVFVAFGVSGSKLVAEFVFFRPLFCVFFAYFLILCFLLLFTVQSFIQSVFRGVAVSHWKLDRALLNFYFVFFFVLRFLIATASLSTAII